MGYKRMFDYPAAWKSTKLSKLKENTRVEFFYLYGIADANGNMELDPRAIHSEVYAFLRPWVTLQDLEGFLEEFKRIGLLYTWEFEGKTYGHWVGSTKSGRLPPPSQHDHNPRLRDFSGHPIQKPTLEQIEHYLKNLPKAAPPPALFPASDRVRDAANTSAAEAQKRARQNGDEVQRLRTAKLNEFLAAYPGDKADDRAIQIEFDKIPITAKTGDPCIAILFENLPLWSAYWAGDDPKYIPHAENFLSSGRWAKKPEVGNGRANSGERFNRSTGGIAPPPGRRYRTGTTI